MIKGLVLYGAIFSVVCTGGSGTLQAAVEGEYQETEIDLPRDDQGVQLNDTADVRRAIPDNRKMNTIVSNVVKAEERDQYTSRMIQDVRKEMNGRIDILETRIAEIQGQVIGLKRALVRSGTKSQESKEGSVTQSESAGSETAPPSQAAIY